MKQISIVFLTLKEIKSITIANKYSETEFDMRFLDVSYNKNKRFIFDNIRCTKIFSISYSVESHYYPIAEQNKLELLMSF